MAASFPVAAAGLAAACVQATDDGCVRGRAGGGGTTALARTGNGCFTGVRVPGGLSGVAGKKERQRRLARERYERRAERQAQRYQRTRRWTAIGAVCFLAIAVAAGGYFLFRGQGQHAQAAAGSTP